MNNHIHSYLIAMYTYTMMLHVYIQKGMSPLNIASERDYVEVAKVLLEYRPDINLPNNVRLYIMYRLTLDQ